MSPKEWMSFPPAHMLVGAGLGELAAARAGLPRGRAWALAAVCSVLPDLDIVLEKAVGQGTEHHGTFSHSILATVILGLLVAAVAGRCWGLVALAGYGSHLLVDLLDDRGRTNVQLAWPFSREQAVAIDRVFPKVEFARGGGVEGAARSLLTPEAVDQLVRQTLVGLVFFAVLLGVGWAVRRARRGEPRGAA